MSYTGVFKRGNTWKWDITVKGKRKYGYCKTELDAVTAREEAREYLNSNVCGKDTLKHVIDYLLATDWSIENSKSHNWFKLHAEKLMIYFSANKPLSEIQNAQICNYVLYLKKHNKSNGTINRKLSLLSKILHKAYELGYIDRIPLIRKMKEPQGRMRFVSPDEERIMLEYLSSNNEVEALNAIIVLIDTGIRTGELQKLTFNHVDFINNTITLIDTKNGENRTVPLTRRAKSALLTLQAHSSDNKHFVSQQAQWLRYPWERLKKAMNLENDDEFVPHCLRHTCASRLVQRGAPLYTVAKWLGHKTLITTKRYAHLRPEELFKISELLEQDY